MFAKVFAQIFDSSIAEDWRIRHVFEDFLKLADKDGIVDMTPESIARRTNMPLELIQEGINALLMPDATSRTPDLKGKRIVPLDTHRNWGWRIVNFAKYRESATKEMLRMAEAERKQEWRRRKGFPNPLPKQREAEAKADTEADMSQVCPGQSRTSPGHKNGSADSKAVFDAWNDLGTVPRCLVVSDKRRRTLEVRLREPFFSANWRAAMAKIKTSEFCRGGGEHGWKASFDWFLQPDSVAKTMEGKYDERTKTNRRNTPENPRNVGTCKPVIPYAEAIAAKLSRQREAAAGMAGKMVQDAASPPAVAVNGG